MTRHLIPRSPALRLFDNWPAFPAFPEFGWLGYRRSPEPRRFVPAVDVRDTGNELLLEADLPGIRKEDVKVTFEDGRLTIEGSHAETTDAEDAPAYTRRERIAGSFQRTFDVPDTVEADRISADFRDGVLTVTLPRTEKARPRQIDVAVR